MRQRTRQSTRSPGDAALWMLAWALLAVVVVFSLGPEAHPVEDAGISDKMQHVGGYGATALAFLLAAVWRPGRGPGALPRGDLAIVVALGVLGAFLEALQSPLPERTAEVADALANGVGVAAGAAIWSVARALSRREPGARWRAPRRRGGRRGP